MSKRPRRTPDRVTCAFCGRHSTLENDAAIDLGWQPSFWIVGQSGATNEPENGCVCANCIKHLVDDPLDRQDGMVLKHGHARFLRAKRARRLAMR